MSTVILKGHKVSKGKAEGEALVTRDPIAFFGGVRPEDGMITDKLHELCGTSVAGKVLLFPHEKGSAGGSSQIYELMVCNAAPKAMINIKAGSIVAVGAISSGIPMMDKVVPDPYAHIETGDWVSIDADLGIITVTKRVPGSAP